MQFSCLVSGAKDGKSGKSQTNESLKLWWKALHAWTTTNHQWSYNFKISSQLRFKSRLNHSVATNHPRNEESGVRDSAGLAANKRKRLSAILKRVRSAGKASRGAREARARLEHKELAQNAIRVTALSPEASLRLLIRTQRESKLAVLGFRKYSSLTALWMDNKSWFKLI